MTLHSRAGGNLNAPYISIKILNQVENDDPSQPIIVIIYPFSFGKRIWTDCKVTN